MRILVDLQGSRDRGIGRYAHAIARAIARNRGKHRIFFLLNGLLADHVEDVIAAFDGLADRDHFVLFHGAGPVHELDAGNRWRLDASEILYEKLIVDLRIDATLVISLFEGAVDDSVLSIGRLPRRHVVGVVLHDLIPLIDPKKYLGYAPAAAWYHRKVAALRQADRLLAVSHSARNEALTYLDHDPARVIRIGAAASDAFHAARTAANTDAAAVLAKHGITRSFVMHTSAFEDRKNFQGLVRAYARLPDAVRTAHQLVLVCKISDNDRKAMMKLAAEAGLGKNEMVLTGFVTDAELIALYTHCRLFAFPSFHEGFGLPALEAMSCGAATIGSAVSSIPEVIGWDEALFDPQSSEEMAALIERALTDEAFHEALKANAARQAAAFDWDGTARAAIAALEQAVAESRSLSPALSDDAIAATIAQSSGTPTIEDMANIAVAMSRNEAEARRIAALGAEDGLTWRIEGPFDSSYSLALVNRETARALEQLGHSVILHSTEGPGDIPASPHFLAANPDLARMHARVAQTDREGADITSRNLYPPRVHDFPAGPSAMHHYPWEESGFPHAWVDAFNQHLTFLTCTATHVEKLLIDNGVTVPITVTGNGVDHWDRIVAAPGYRVEARAFRFLHVSSCFPRKGVEVLLDAYGRTFSAQDDVSLIIKTFANPHNEIEAMLAERRGARADYPDVRVIMEDMAEPQLKALYEQCHVMVCPSMAEGFGLPLAEGMMSGLPAITTGWSGQLDFCNQSNAWLVDYSFERARTHFGLYSSAWARADVDALAAAMRDARGRSPDALRAMAAAGCGQLLADHRWIDVAARLVEAKRMHGAGTPAPAPRIGWLTTWNEKCGIGTYSQHLIEAMDGDVTVLAAATSTPLGPDGANVVRCWRAGKTSGGLADVADVLVARGIDTLVIQFNYAFFNHEELAALIDDATASGCVVVMILHSTVDPVREIPGSELHRIAATLARCDRLLVHSVADLNRLKQIGLVDNVALFPHGALTAPAALARAKGDVPIISTFGFCLPHKGLEQVVEAVALLRDRGTPVRLRMINAEFPAAVSASLAANLRSLIAQRGLADLVELRTDFLEDAESLSLLAEAELSVFAYQPTGESASGAVRYGLAAGRPVLVTPQAIFDDLGEAVFRLAGSDPAAIADGIAIALRSIREGSEEARRAAEAADAWRAQHDYATVGKRLHNICRALRARKPAPLHKAAAASHTSELVSA